MMRYFLYMARALTYAASLACAPGCGGDADDDGEQPSQSSTGGSTASGGAGSSSTGGASDGGSTATGGSVSSTGGNASSGGANSTGGSGTGDTSSGTGGSVATSPCAEGLPGVWKIPGYEAYLQVDAGCEIPLFCDLVKGYHTTGQADETTIVLENVATVEYTVNDTVLSLLGANENGGDILFARQASADVIPETCLQ